MVSKGYHYVINLGIVSNSVSIDPVYPGFCDRESIVVGELRGIFSLFYRSLMIIDQLSTMSFDRT